MNYSREQHSRQVCSRQVCYRQRHSRRSRFTIIDVTIVAATLAPILMAVLGTTQNVRNSMATVNEVGQLTEQVDSMIARVGRLTRRAIAGSLQSRATRSDVDTITADPSISVAPTEGDWIAPPSFADRTDIRFRTVSGFLNINTTASIGPCVLEFVRDPAEARNGIDDDGDGLVDEGKLVLSAPDAETTELPSVEIFSVTATGSVMHVRVRVAHRDSSGRIRRVFRHHTIQIRNT